MLSGHPSSSFFVSGFQAQPRLRGVEACALILGLTLVLVCYRLLRMRTRVVRCPVSFPGGGRPLLDYWPLGRCWRIPSLVEHGVLVVGPETLALHWLAWGPCAQGACLPSCFCQRPHLSWLAVAARWWCWSARYCVPEAKPCSAALLTMDLVC